MPSYHFKKNKRDEILFSGDGRERGIRPDRQAGTIFK